MITINIAKDFTREPGARNYQDGADSGQEFFDKLLKPKYMIYNDNYKKFYFI